jgi:OTU-like cysteine protease/A20-like zinc finger
LFFFSFLSHQKKINLMMSASSGSQVGREALHFSRHSNSLAEEIRTRLPTQLSHDNFLRDNATTLMLPSMHSYSREFKQFLRSDMLQTEHLVALTSEASVPSVNFDGEFAALRPLQTEGDGNCLLHAVLLFIFGVHDRRATLRQALRRYIEQGRVALKQRFVDFKLAAAASDNETSNDGEREKLVEALDEIFDELVDATSLELRVNEFGKARYEFLEQFHVFAVSQLIRRPIIVFAKAADGNGSLLTRADRIDGIYLPVLVDASLCHREPVLLSYHSNHFAALVVEKPPPQEGSNNVYVARIPLVSARGSPFPVHCLVADEAAHSESLLAEYLELVETPARHIRCCLLRDNASGKSSPAVIEQMLVNYLERARVLAIDAAKRETESAPTGPCLGRCGFSGSQQFDGFCSKCHMLQSNSARSADFCMAHLPARDAVEDSKLCVHCGQFVGTRERLYMCSVDFVRYTKGEISLTASSPKPATEPEPARERCLGGCGFFGDPNQLLGFCSKCYATLVLPHLGT